MVYYTANEKYNKHIKRKLFLQKQIIMTILSRLSGMNEEPVLLEGLNMLVFCYDLFLNVKGYSPCKVLATSQA